MKKLLKLLGALTLVLVVGALGSGLWERAFSPALDWVVGSVVRAIAAVSSGFSDYVYREAAKGFHEKPSLVLLSFVLVGAASYFSGAWFGMWTAEREERLRMAPSRLRSALTHRLMGFVLSALAIMVLILLMQASYSNRIATYSLNSIEILGASVTNATRLELRSQFFSMRRAEDFAKLNERLTSLAVQADVQLPDFDPL